jgi:hypothetical protein
MFESKSSGARVRAGAERMRRAPAAASKATDDRTQQASIPDIGARNLPTLDIGGLGGFDIVGTKVSCRPSPVVSYAIPSVRPSPVVSTGIGGTEWVVLGDMLLPIAGEVAEGLQDIG